MAKKWIVTICAAAAVLLAAGITLAIVFWPAGPYTGTVLETGTNTPISNVSVSDGRNVVKTDKEGKFTLKGYRKSRFITVTVPAGYTTEQYYIPIEKEKDAYAFTLDKSAATAKENHSFIQISDSEIGADGVGDWLGYLQQLVADNNPAFLMHTGDICYEDGLKRHLKDMNTENMGCPVRYTIGNHDYVKGKYGEELFESIYGPVWYSFEVGNIHYVVTPFQSGSDYKSGYNKDDRWRWLENDLANTDSNKKVVIFNHTKAPSDDYVLSFDRKELDLKKHNLVAWLYGHYHYNYVSETSGVLGISTARPDCGGIDSSASGARIISIDGNGSITTKMVYYDQIASPAKPENAVWSTQLAGNVLFCDTLEADGLVYTATADDNAPRKCGVYAIDQANGSIKWFYETKNSIKNNLIYQDKKIYAQDADGNVYCIDAVSGSLVWKKKADLTSSLGTSSGICLDGDSLFVGCAANVTALSAKNGDVLWNNNRGHGENSPAEFVVAGDKLLVNSHWDALVALDKTTGKQLWECKDEDIRFRSSTPAIVDDNTLFVADDDALMLIDANTGKMLDKKNIEDGNFSSSAQPLIAENIAYVPTATKGLLAYDLKAKKVLWETAVGQAMVYTAPYTKGDSETIEGTPILSEAGNLVFGASDGYVYTVNKTDGKILKKQSFGASVLGKVVLDGDSVIAGDFTGRITKVK